MDKIRSEKSVDKIKKKKKKTLEEAKELLEKIAKQFKKQEEKIGKKLLEAHKETKKQEKERNTLFTCPKCKEGKLVMLRSKKGKRFAACNRYPKCKTTFPLPQYGFIKVSENKCECGFPFLILIRKGKRPWEFCINPIHRKED
jgi:DNA topoisomerase-1